MPNCTYSDVRLIINTSLPPADLTSLITLADQEITDRTLTARSTNTLKIISMLITASYASLRDPQSGPVGEGSVSYRGPSEWRRMAEDLIIRSGEPPIVVGSDNTGLDSE